MIERLLDTDLIMDGFDDAIVGVAQIFVKNPETNSVRRVIYDENKCIDILVSTGMSEEDAIEFLDYNIVNAYHGVNTPMIVKFHWPII